MIVATLEGTHDVYAVRRDFDDIHPNGITRRQRLTEDLSKVRICLTTEINGVALNNSDMMLEVTREPEFKAKLTSLVIWKRSHLLDFIIEGRELILRIYVGEIEEQVARDVKDWETRAANFLEKHFGKQDKESFLKSVPSIEQGVQQARRLFFPLPGQEGHPNRPYWMLSDSINVRIERLDGLMR